MPVIFAEERMVRSELKETPSHKFPMSTRERTSDPEHASRPTNPAGVSATRVELSPSPPNAAPYLFGPANDVGCFSPQVLLVSVRRACLRDSPLSIPRFDRRTFCGMTLMGRTFVPREGSQVCSGKSRPFSFFFRMRLRSARALGGAPVRRHFGNIETAITATH